MLSKPVTLTLLAALALALSVFAASLLRKDTSTQEACLPSFHDGGSLSVQVGHYWHFEVEFILIGCKENLSISEDESARVRSVISEFVSKYHLLFARKSREDLFRSLVCTSINRELTGGNRIDNIHFSTIHFSEVRPEIEPSQ